METDAGPAAAKEEAKVEDTKEEAETMTWDSAYSKHQVGSPAVAEEDEATAGCQMAVHGGTITVH